MKEIKNQNAEADEAEVDYILNGAKKSLKGMTEKSKKAG